MSELLKLAERCEAATGPLFSLECAIWRALYGSYSAPPPYYTASLDAAMTLAENSGYAGLLLEIAKNAIAERFAHECLSADDYRTALARAFCAAALRARAANVS